LTNQYFIKYFTNAFDKPVTSKRSRRKLYDKARPRLIDRIIIIITVIVVVIIFIVIIDAVVIIIIIIIIIFII
jgi:hypothetical protein